MEEQLCSLLDKYDITDLIKWDWGKNYYSSVVNEKIADEDIGVRTMISSYPIKEVLDEEDLKYNDFFPVSKENLNYMTFVKRPDISESFQWFLLTSEGSWFEEFHILVESVYGGYQVFTSLEMVPEIMEERIIESLDRIIEGSRIPVLSSQGSYTIDSSIKDLPTYWNVTN